MVLIALDSSPRHAAKFRLLTRIRAREQFPNCYVLARRVSSNEQQLIGGSSVQWILGNENCDYPEFDHIFENDFFEVGSALTDLDISFRKQEFVAPIIPNFGFRQRIDPRFCTLVAVIIPRRFVRARIKGESNDCSSENWPNFILSTWIIHS